MKHLFHSLLSVFVLFSLASPVLAEDVAGNKPMPLPQAKPLGPVKVEGLKREVYYIGQRAQHGVIDLTPNAAYFKGFHFDDRDESAATPTFGLLVKGVVDEAAGEDRAVRKQESVEDVKKVFAGRGATAAELAKLDEPSDAELPVARWHLYCEKGGDITLTAYMKVTAAEAGEPWVVGMARGDQLETTPIVHQQIESQPLPVVESDGSKPQPRMLTFHVKEAGRVTFYFDQRAMPRAAGAIAFIRLQGSAIEHASLLRTRYRPSAFHFGVGPSADCPDPKMWVIETKPLEGNGAFSPVTTPFGYFGMMFKNLYVPAGSAFHFSMWGSAEGKDGIVMARAPRVIASANSKIVSQVNANEGTTVRGSWGFYTEPAVSVIQALRATREADGSITYYGYVYDQTAHRWKLYDAGQLGAHHGRVFKPSGSGKEEIVPIAKAGSFIEVPGAFGVQMTGDVRRKFARRGWYLGSDDVFHPAQIGGKGESPDTDEPPATKADDDKDSPTIKGLRNMGFLPMDGELESQGWALATTGGMAYFAPGSSAASHDTSARVLPEYLQPDKAKGLFELPVQFAGTQATHVGGAEATIEYDIANTGPNSKATVYYGTEDCNAHIASEKAVDAFDKQQEKQAEAPATAAGKGDSNTGNRFHNAGTEKAKLDILSHGWKLHTDAQDLQPGPNTFTLKDLQPNTKYYYRIHVVHDEGMSWDYTSGTFTTGDRR